MLAEEFLNLLVVILGERYVPGIGMVDEDDVVRREVIHHLCIAPMPHSELSKNLPEDSNHETGIERVIHQVATFKNPTEGSMGGKGIFELKPEYYKQYNPYFYHYSRAEQSKSEESQMKRKKQANEDYDERNILSLLESLVGSENITHDSSKDLLTWVLKFFIEVKQMQMSSDSLHMDTLDQVSSTAGQKSAEKERKAKIAAKRRAKIMAQISDMQKNFIKDNAELFKNTDPDMANASSDMDIRSTVLSQCRSKVLSDGETHDPLLTSADLNTGTFTSSCGHIMHSDCWQRFFDAILAKERRRPLRFRPSLSYNVDQMEFLCPLCECINNTVIPLVPSLPTLCTESNKKQVNVSFDEWLKEILKMRQFYKKVEKHPAKSTKESVAHLLLGCVCVNPSIRFSDDLKEMMKKFSRDVYSFGLKVEPDDKNERVPIVVWNTCAFTIQTIEQFLRLEQRALFGGLSSRQSDCLGALIKFAAVCGQVIPHDVIKHHCLRLLSELMQGKQDKEDETFCILDYDMFHYLTLLTMTLPSLYTEKQHSDNLCIPSGGVNDHNVLYLILTAHLVQIMLTCDVPCQAMETESGDPDSEALLRIFKNLRKNANIKPTETHLLPWQLKTYLKEACLPFLRCTGILFQNITSVPPPAELTEAGREDEFEALCRYLALPLHLSELFENNGLQIQNLVEIWSSSNTVKDRFSASSEAVVTYPLPVNQLIELPQDYSELINKVSTFTCPKSDGDESRAPTMCLVCGKMLCSQSYCCQTEIEGVTVGAATEHIYKCGAGTGIFLRVRECQILLLSGRTKGCFVPPPYLDIYGETDQGLRRGNPLHLSSENYRSLQKLWFSHSIPETVAHNLESNTNLLTIDWQHL
ncbi:hypothetical protein KUTeg_009175 [Tegillarca granosa]|uniref:E3 ubiquitin-protein ligase n=1 Tax=Tegillarca granosa TaxID=220873 RepID=A0ABQ9FC44_TEGGR|nr:hypothetical protein KUTeg_009175 [Tegillarca granosa]